MSVQEAIVVIEINGREVSLGLNELPDLIFSKAEGRNEIIKSIYYFLVGGPFSEASHWHPWLLFPIGLEPVIPHLNDKHLQNLGLTFCQIDKRFYQQIQEWAVALARFFGYEVPPTETVYKRITRRRRSYQENEIPVWMLQVEFQNLALQLQEIIKASEAVTAQIIEHRKEAYPDHVTPEQLGDQRAKDLIDRANEQPGISAQQAIKLLKRALRYGTTG